LDELSMRLIARVFRRNGWEDREGITEYDADLFRGAKMLAFGLSDQDQVTVARQAIEAVFARLGVRYKVLEGDRPDPEAIMVFIGYWSSRERDILRAGTQV
jgi:hypothetical protein